MQIIKGAGQWAQPTAGTANDWVEHLKVPRLRVGYVAGVSARRATGGSATRRTSRSAVSERYVYRAIDQDGQVIDVLVSARRDDDTARRFLRRALTMLKVTPSEVVTDAAAIYTAVLDPVGMASRRAARKQLVEADHSSDTDSDRCAGCRPTGPRR